MAKYIKQISINKGAVTGVTAVDLPGLLFSNVNVPVGNTVTSTSETALTSKATVKANTLQDGDVLTVKLAGTYGGTVLPTLRGKVKFGGVTIADTTPITGLVTGSGLAWRAEITAIIQDTGVGTGTGMAASLQAEGAAFFSTALITALNVLVASTQNTSINTEVDNDVTVTIQWGVGGTGQTITLDQMTVKVERVP